MFYTNNLLLSINVVENLKYFTIYRRSSIFYIEIFESFYSVVNCTLSEVLSFFILLFLFLIFHSFSFLFNLPCNLAYTPLLSKRERERDFRKAISSIIIHALYFLCIKCNLEIPKSFSHT